MTSRRVRIAMSRAPLAAVAETGSLTATAWKVRGACSRRWSRAIHLHVLGHDQKRLARLDDLLEQRQKILDPASF